MNSYITSLSCFFYFYQKKIGDHRWNDLAFVRLIMEIFWLLVVTRNTVEDLRGGVDFMEKEGLPSKCGRQSRRKKHLVKLGVVLSRYFKSKILLN